MTVDYRGRGRESRGPRYHRAAGRGFQRRPFLSLRENIVHHRPIYARGNEHQRYPRDCLFVQSFDGVVLRHFLHGVGQLRGLFFRESDPGRFQRHGSH